MKNTGHRRSGCSANRKTLLSIRLSILAAAAVLLTAASLNAQSGWKTVKDKTGVCQMSFPPDWTPLSTPGLVNPPKGITAMVTSGIRPYRPFSAETLKVLNVDQVFENSPARLFYAGKPTGTPAHVNYHVEVPGKVNDCVAQFSLPVNSSADEAKRLALSLTKTP